MPELIAEYMRVYGLGARDAFALIDVLQTSAVLAQGSLIELHFLLPLAIAVVQGHPPGTVPQAVVTSKWVYVPYWTPQSSDVTEVTLHEMTMQLHEAAQLTDRDLDERRAEEHSYAARFISRSRAKSDGSYPIATPRGYPGLLAAVARFTNPQLEPPG